MLGSRGVLVRVEYKEWEGLHAHVLRTCVRTCAQLGIQTLTRVTVTANAAYAMRGSYSATASSRLSRDIMERFPHLLVGKEQNKVWRSSAHASTAQEKEKQQLVTRHLVSPPFVLFILAHARTIVIVRARDNARSVT
jgi:hypothetical protein